MSKINPVLCRIMLFCIGLLVSACVGTGSEGGPPGTLTGNHDSVVEVKVALIHFNPRLGAVAENVRALNGYIAEAFSQGAKIVVTPELATTGFSIAAKEVLNGHGFSSPFSELDGIRDLAVRHQGYVFVAIAEVSKEQKPYNTVLAFGPQGLLRMQRKRGVATWNERGDLPFEIILSPFGDLATVICSDSYLQDWIRILTLKGADIVVAPANWWGDMGQEQIWRTRAFENGIWMAVANRWGEEIDTRYGAPYTYNMNDAPSALIGPDGTVVVVHRAADDPAPRDTIVYATIRVPRSRIGTLLNDTYAVQKRRPAAYQALANTFYRPDSGNQRFPDLPPTGITRVGVLSYSPAESYEQNLARVRESWQGASVKPEVVVLPALGVSSETIDTSTPEWSKKAPWGALQEFIEQSDIRLLVTTVYERSWNQSLVQESLVLLRPGRSPAVYEQIHDYAGVLGARPSPVHLDLAHARVGVLTGMDVLFPETTEHLAKTGVDIVLVSSKVGTASTEPRIHAGVSVDAQMLLDLWKTRTNDGFHFAASDATGYGLLVKDNGGFTLERMVVHPGETMKVMEFDSNLTRDKHLNAFYMFDLETLLETK